MSARFQSLPIVEMLASSAGAIPLGPQLPPRARQLLKNSTAGRGGFVTAATASPLRVRPRTQADVVRLVALTCGQGASIRAGDWTLGSRRAGPEPADAVLLDLTRLDRVTGITDGGIWAEAGTVLSQVNRACRRHQKSLQPQLRDCPETAGREAALAIHHARHVGDWDETCWITRVRFVSVEPSPRILCFDFADTVAWLERTGLSAVVLEVQAHLLAAEAVASVRSTYLRQPAFPDTLPDQVVS